MQVALFPAVREFATRNYLLGKTGLFLATTAADELLQFGCLVKPRKNKPSCSVMLDQLLPYEALLREKFSYSPWMAKFYNLFKAKY